MNVRAIGGVCCSRVGKRGIPAATGGLGLMLVEMARAITPRAWQLLARLYVTTGSHP